MTDMNRRRLILYPVALLLLSGLGYAGFVYEAPPDAETLVNGAELLAQVGNHEKAIENAEKALKLDPDHRYANIILGYCYSEQGNFAKSLEHYDRAVELTEAGDESLSLLRLYRADVLVRAGRHEAAEKEAQDILATDAGQTQAWYVIARSRKERGLLDGAAEAYRAAREANSEAPDPLILLVRLEEERGHLKKALTVSDEAVKAFPDTPAVALQRVRILWKCDRRDQAAETFLQTHEKHPRAARRFLATEEDLVELKQDERIVAALQVDAATPGGKGEEK